MAEITFLELENEIGVEATIILMVEQLGMTEDYAKFALAMERGEVDGDLIAEEDPE